MRTLKYLHINPTNPLWQVKRSGDRPHGLRVFRFSMLPSLYVAAAMPPYVETRIIDEEVEPIDFDTDADLIGISFMTFNAPRAYDVADRFRLKHAKPVIFGGYHPTFMREEAIQHADAICIGEAENNVPRMIADFAAGTLKPFYESPLAELHGLAIPDRTLIRQSAYITPDVLQATRGCPYRCNFCSIAAFHKSAFRTRPVDDVVEELQTLGRFVIFMDDNLIADREYAKALFAAMVPLKKQWFSQCGIAITYDRELLELAARSGCRGLFVGFESLSQENLSAWRKPVNRARDYRRAIDALHEAGIAVFAGFVFGMDHDTPKVFEQTLSFLLDAQVDVLQATNLTPFPGTPLFDEMDRQGRIFDKDWRRYDFGHVVFEPLQMSPETLERGTAWVLWQFYERKPILRRLWRALGYLDPVTLLRAVAVLNLGYRRRFQMSGMSEKGRRFVPPGSVDQTLVRS